MLSLHLQLSSVKLQPTSGDFSAANGIMETSRESPTVNISSRDDSYTVRCWMGSLNGALHRILIIVSQENKHGYPVNRRGDTRRTNRNRREKCATRSHHPQIHGLPAPLDTLPA